MVNEQALRGETRRKIKQHAPAAKHRQVSETPNLRPLGQPFFNNQDLRQSLIIRGGRDHVRRKKEFRRGKEKYGTEGLEE